LPTPRPAADPNASSAAGPVDSNVLDRAALHGAVWVGATKPVTQAVSWIVTILVARLLTPHDYGLTTMAGAFLGMVSILGEFGIVPRSLVADTYRQIGSRR
jgi:hypothetical protein